FFDVEAEVLDTVDHLMSGVVTGAANQYVSLVASEQKGRLRRVADEIQITGNVIRIGTGVAVGVHGLAPQGIKDAAEKDGKSDDETHRDLAQRQASGVKHGPRAIELSNIGHKYEELCVKKHALFGAGAPLRGAIT